MKNMASLNLNHLDFNRASAMMHSLSTCVMGITWAKENGSTTMELLCCCPRVSPSGFRSGKRLT